MCVWVVTVQILNKNRFLVPGPLSFVCPVPVMIEFHPMHTITTAFLLLHSWPCRHTPYCSSDSHTITTFTRTRYFPLAAFASRPGPSLLAHVDARRPRGPTLLWLARVDDSLLDVSREAVKRLLNVLVRLGRHLEERNAELVGQRLAPLDRYHSLLFPVALVADEDLVDAFGCVLFDVCKPGADVWFSGVNGFIPA